MNTTIVHDATRDRVRLMLAESDRFGDALFHIPTRDLLTEIETTQWIATDTDDVSRAYAEHVLAAMVGELERRQRLHASGDPLRPSWPRDLHALNARRDAVKREWSMERFCRELVCCDLERVGPDRLRGQCPLPGHDDRNPSFFVTPSKNLAWCFGCQRGGDVIALAKWFTRSGRYTDAIAMLERADRGAA